jgi:DNA polymerase III delta prime subunit
VAKDAYQKVLADITAEGDISIGDVNVRQIIQKSYYSLFGSSSSAPEVDWDRAMQILELEMQPEIKNRLKDSLLGLADVDASEVKPVRQEDSPVLSLEAVKTLTIDGPEAKIIDPHRPIIETYARGDIKGKLLILGTPGAGKTITLLKLAEQLVGEAIENPKTVIPIIFELSTWRDGQKIEAWLIEQLYENYGGNRKRKIYEAWLEHQVLLPLLDGLDELGMVRQQAYPHLVVCCRVNEFREAGVKLSNLRGVVQLEPLSDRQIQDYLAKAGKLGLWEQIHMVPEMGRLMEPMIDLENSGHNEPGLLQVPLFLSLAAQVYEVDKPLKGKTDLFERYIVRQLELDQRENDHQSRRFENRQWAFKTIEAEPDWREVTSSLVWIAKRLRERNKVELLIEQIQPNWLGLPGLPLTKKSYERINSLIIGLILGLIFALIGSQIDCLVLGLILGLVCGLISGPIIELFDIEPFESFQISMSRLFRKENLHNLYLQLGVALAFNLIGVLSDVLVDGKIDNLDKSVSISFAIPIVILISILIKELKGAVKIRSKPNQGIWNSLQSFFWITSLSYPFGIILAAAMTSSFANLARAIIPGIGGALFFGFFGGLLPVIQHLSLRIILTRHYHLPWNLAQFLTYCHERRLLQQIGGRYRFIHRELLDHFAGKAEG